MRQEASTLLRMQREGTLPSPSAMHVDQAYSALRESRAEPDSAKRAERLKEAEILTLMSVRDALEESAATLKQIASGPLIDVVKAVGEASETIKEATKHVVLEGRKVRQASDAVVAELREAKAA